ncbi:TPA: methionine ABC transporter ATP-binding protein [Staphylococcus aureus]|uniref:methionine ABC transporter ATP-binding protein n=1 Tax=Staphylococcus aureus TaxID=1280 RepID=UPI0004457359|nr:methionine ABC transporter ATP-binding protein [Staphylococcus aureus]EWJ24691.1 methionine import ATP-binding protein MetN 2 [Staphylococcus aureus M20198]EWK88202.1 methionine import ATP-binding protein MetN 2 [Staphylococcus aureus M53327]EWT26451.1 methionine import ATP-binding protein MetN 2 [Staphylococcus aureus M32688]EWX16400.1 methionine import ATP-binding protein MetN 2 [Staphylococcus aureus F26021]EYL13030.1 methionine import ATP-binding protein MetN 2 [Staphylococcus aureus W5
MIELKEVVKEYRTKNKEVLAVDHVNLSIRAGSIYGVIGFSGAGKSTLIRMFNHLEAPTSGEVIIDGDHIGQLSKNGLRAKRQKVSMIFQHFNLLWSRTVLKNIMFPLEIAGVPRRRAKQKALELVELVGLKGREKAYPSELSGGQKQRVGIARALANDPTVLLCDEATSALDPQTTDEILDLLLKIREQQNLTIVLITHEMHVIRRICDEVAVMESGKVIEQGPVTQVFENPQHTVTKRFVKDDLNDDFETSLTELEPLEKDAYIVRLVFAGSTTTEPIVSILSTAYDIKINILEANIKNTKNGTVGFLVLHIPYISSVDFGKFEKELIERQVKMEVLRHG